MATQLRPLGDRVVIEPLEREQTTASGIVLPDTAKEKPQEGKVLAVGNGKYNETTGARMPVDLSKDDIVIYAKYAGSEVKVDNKDLLILSERDVLAVVANGAHKK